LFLFSLHTPAQQEQRPTPSPQDVLRTDVSLIQTGVTVLDKEGRFVGGLTADQFNLTVDGRPQPISFFEEVMAGTAEESSNVAGNAGGRPSSTRSRPAKPGRVVIFFLDDLHMATESMMRARKLIQHFVDRQMNEEDVAAIACASGQLGFLQQVTGNADVLHAAIERLKTWPQVNGDGQLPLMSEYAARAIDVDYDRDLMETYVQALIRDGYRRQMAEAMVRTRASSILQKANTDTRNTLRSLDSMMRAIAPMMGRKLIFFVSDGFLLTRTDSDVAATMRDVTDATVRAGAVIYALDARGLATDHWLDAGAGAPPPDGGGQLARVEVGAMSASQEALHFLAEQTGGRALLNTSAQTAAIDRTINETAKYYLLAWRPDAEQRNRKFRQVEVTVKGRPDLIVLVQRGVFDGATNAAARHDQKPAAKTGDILNSALAAAVPIAEVRTNLDLSYELTDKTEAVVTALISVPVEALQLGAGNKTALEIAGYVVNLDGKIGSRFAQQLSMTMAEINSASDGRGNVLYRHQIKVEPGIYQVRVAAMDLNSRKAGSAAEWIKVPEVKLGEFTLGTFTLGERPPDTGQSYNVENFLVQRNAERRFKRDIPLRFIIYIYNARGTPPDLRAYIQVLRDGLPVLSYNDLRVDPGAAGARGIAYGAEIPLDTLSPGRYVLQLTVTNGGVSTKAAARTHFLLD
jgi:VWFA-related protein